MHIRDSGKSVFLKHLAAASLLAGLCTAARAGVILVDFGASNSFRGVSVGNPDANGHYWNNFAPGDFLSNMQGSSNEATSVDLGFSTSIGTDSYNGPAGVTSDPPTTGELAQTAFDAAALGELGVTNAVFDYFGTATNETARFVLTGLNPAKVYALTFFGSRKYPNGEAPGDDLTRSTTYEITTSNNVVLASTNLRVGVSADHNSNTVATLAGLSPDSENKLFVAFHGSSSSNSGYLNCLRIEITDPPPPPPAETTILIDFGNDASYNGATVANPDDNGLFWNSVWSGAFYADLLNISNQATGVDLGFDAAAGTDNYNGPTGDVDTAALGALGGATNAVNDYYLSSSFQIQGLNPFRTYTLTFFGSHKFSTDDATVYSIYSDSSYTQLVASASLNVQTPGSPWLHNRDQVAVITNLSPQAGNILYVKFQGGNGGDGYLNAMKIDVFAGALTYDEWSTNYPALGPKTADDDGDGLANLAEFALGGDPANPANSGYSPEIKAANIAGQRELVYVYARRTGDRGISYQVEANSNLLASTWTDAGFTEAGAPAPINGEFESVTNLVPAVETRQFIRLMIDEP